MRSRLQRRGGDPSQCARPPQPRSCTCSVAQITRKLTYLPLQARPPPLHRGIRRMAARHEHTANRFADSAWHHPFVSEARSTAVPPHSQSDRRESCKQPRVLRGDEAPWSKCLRRGAAQLRWSCYWRLHPQLLHNPSSTRVASNSRHPPTTTRRTPQPASHWSQITQWMYLWPAAARPRRAQTSGSPLLNRTE